MEPEFQTVTLAKDELPCDWVSISPCNLSGFRDSLMSFTDKRRLAELSGLSLIEYGASQATFGFFR